ncbi:tyrosine-type recombinase/integrase [Lacticaseibacillus paracasei]|uniref:tyrosine-type recombinase/integrase n=1 Tax=Lacticaseibacillus paracasei TaxID=1597 RepID=UPI003DA613A1
MQHPAQAASRVSFSNFAKNYIDLYRSKGSPRTYALYQNTVKKIKDQFNDCLLTSITRDELQKWLNDFGKSHAITTGEKLYRQLHVIIGAALDEGIISRDISKGLIYSGSKPQAADYKFLEYDEYITLLNYLRDNATFNQMTEEMMLFALMTGSRYGEVAGMTWDDINFKTATININKQWNPRLHKFMLTKNHGKSDRIVSIPDQYLPQLKEMKRVQQLYLKNTEHQRRHDWEWKTTTYHEEDMMFLSFTFKVPQNDSVNRRLDELHYQLGIKRIGMHGMRHTHATRLIYAGYSDWYIAKRLGHNSLKELHRTYGHVFEQMQAEADTKLRASIGQDYLGKASHKIVKIDPK